MRLPLEGTLLEKLRKIDSRGNRRRRERGLGYGTTEGVDGRCGGSTAGSSAECRSRRDVWPMHSDRRNGWGRPGRHPEPWTIAVGPDGTLYVEEGLGPGSNSAI